MIEDPTINRDARNLAQQIINAEAAIAIARQAARKCGVVNEHAFNELRLALAYNYAQGYIRGLRIGRKGLVVPPPPPSEPKA